MKREIDNKNEKEVEINLNKYNEFNQDIKSINKQNIEERLKPKTEIQPKTAREKNILKEHINNDSNYSIELIEEEEEEINSDEYISSTNLDVETNTYIEYSEINANENKSKTKNLKKFVKAINLNNKNYLNQYGKRDNSNSNHKNQSKKKDYYEYNNNNKKSKFKQKIKINDNNEKFKNKDKREIIYKKLNVKDIQDKNEKEKINQNMKNIDKDNIKNYSLLEYHFLPLNNIYDVDLNINKINNNTKIIKKKTKDNKNINKRVDTDADVGNIKKIFKHIRSPTLVDNNINKNKYMIEFLLKQKYQNNDKHKNKKNIMFSPINNKIGINSMRTINNLSNNSRVMTLNNKNNYKYNKYIVNKNIINNNINYINHITFSPSRKIIEKPLNKKINYNSINIENNQKNSINSKINQFSDRLLTYDFQEHKLLARNRTFKNKRQINNKNKFYNLLLNKKKINLSQAKELLISSNKSPRLKMKMKIDNHSKLNLHNFQNKNKSYYSLLNSNTVIKSASNQKYNEQYNTINQSTNRQNNKNGHKNNKYNPPNIPNKINNSIKLNNNIKINPFNEQINKQNKFMKKNNLSQSKSIYKFNKIENQSKVNEINITSIGSLKDSLNNNIKIKNENIVNKKKNKIRAKTLIEEDYLRNLIINSINHDNNINKIFINNNSNKNKKDNNSNNKFISLNLLKNTTNYTASSNNMIIKNPTERHNINFNININMNNNNYKKLVYHYHGLHGHNKSSINYSHSNFNSNVDKIEKKKIKI